LRVCTSSQMTKHPSCSIPFIYWQHSLFLLIVSLTHLLTNYLGVTHQGEKWEGQEAHYYTDNGRDFKMLWCKGKKINQGLKGNESTHWICKPWLLNNSSQGRFVLQLIINDKQLSPIPSSSTPQQLNLKLTIEISVVNFGK